MRAIAIVVLALLGLAPAATAQVPELVYRRLATRAETRAAALETWMPRLQLGDWWVLGPFANPERRGHDVAYAPELAVDLDMEVEDKDGRPARWSPIPDEGWSRLDLQRFGSQKRNTEGVAYLHRVVESSRAEDVAFEAGSDDGLKLWLNGRVVVDADAYRGLDVRDHQFTLPLREGRNEILAKITQGVGGWEFQMRPRLDERLMLMLEHRLDRDFPRDPVRRHWRPITILEPADVVLEVGGLAVTDDGRPIVTTRRGDVWIVDRAWSDPAFDAEFVRFASGLHEPLGAWWDGDGLLVAQRGELTKLIDDDGDDRADRFLTIADGWGVSGNYHEFAFGPEPDAQGRLWVTLNVGFCGSLGKSIVPWRGWAVIVGRDGSITPVCGGLRSPNGIGRNAAGAMFASDNQGDWVGTNKLMHLDFGDWHGHPSSQRWYERAGMPTPRGEQDWKPPAVWFPYDAVGRSPSDILLDDVDGRFGPFGGQLLVGDQFGASISRVDLEQVNGVWQGACIPFIDGLDSGVNRLAWAPDGSLLVGMTNRGWWSYGPRQWGLQRIVFEGGDPFEILHVRAQPDGFTLEFTRPIDTALAADPASYAMESFTHERWEKYGSPEIERRAETIRAVEVAPDGRSVRLRTGPLRPRFIHAISAAGVRAADGTALLHDRAWYTLNEIP